MAERDRPTAELPESVGRYRVQRLLGEGAMGRVLLAHDPVLDREVAVKHLRADLNIPDDVRRGLVTRMRHEARAAARVMHPHLVTLHDMGEDERVGLYLVFEYVEGPTLKERVARGRMPPKDAARASVELGTALTTAHDAGILHRDIKPENVILSKKGAKIADFGIAKIPDSTLTHQGGLIGTPAYSSPETFRTSTFSPESDQFSLAATLYEAISGKRAFPGDDAVAVAQRILHETAEPFAAGVELSEEVDRVLARALSRRPRERFPSCEAFGRALADALTAPPGDAGRLPESGDRDAPTGPTASGARGATSVAGRVPRTSQGLPKEQRTSHIVLGIVAVAVTGMLLVRTALKSEEETSPSVPASATASAPAASTSAPRPRVTPTARPARSTAPGSAGADAGAPSPSESGAAEGPGANGSAEGPGATGPADAASGTASATAAPTDTAVPSFSATSAPTAGPKEPPPETRDAGR